MVYSARNRFVGTEAGRFASVELRHALRPASRLKVSYPAGDAEWLDFESLT